MFCPGSDFSVDEADDDSSDDDYDEENDSDFDCGSKRKKAPVNKKASAVRKQTKQTKQIKSGILLLKTLFGFSGIL